MNNHFSSCLKILIADRVHNTRKKKKKKKKGAAPYVSVLLLLKREPSGRPVCNIAISTC